MNIAEITDELKAKAADNPKLQKQIALLENTLAAANELVSNVQASVRYERKIPRILRKEKYSKKKAAALRFKFVLGIDMARLHNQIIISQPVPKYPKGAMNIDNHGDYIDPEGLISSEPFKTHRLILSDHDSPFLHY